MKLLFLAIMAIVMIGSVSVVYGDHLIGYSINHPPQSPVLPITSADYCQQNNCVLNFYDDSVNIHTLTDTFKIYDFIELKAIQTDFTYDSLTLVIESPTQNFSVDTYDITAGNGQVDPFFIPTEVGEYVIHFWFDGYSDWNIRLNVQDVQYCHGNTRTSYTNIIEGTFDDDYILATDQTDLIFPNGGLNTIVGIEGQDCVVEGDGYNIIIYENEPTSLNVFHHTLLLAWDRSVCVYLENEITTDCKLIFDPTPPTQ